MWENIFGTFSKQIQERNTQSLFAPPQQGQRARGPENPACLNDLGTMEQSDAVMIPEFGY